jgi:uncharacterized protein
VPEQDHIINNTRTWVEDFIVKLNICPFAANILESIEYDVYQGNGDDLENYLALHLKKLEQQPKIETSLLIFPNGFDDFYDYLDLVELCQQGIVQNEYEGIFQVASFHPNYLFENCKDEDPDNFTNRSPYPMLHLLREDSVSSAIDQYGNTNEIPLNNIRLMKQLGYDKLKTFQENKKWL